MLPFFPSLKPSLLRGLRLNDQAAAANDATTEDAELQRLENEHLQWRQELTNGDMMAAIVPVGMESATVGSSLQSDNDSEVATSSTSSEEEEELELVAPRMLYALQIPLEPPEFFERPPRPLNLPPDEPDDDMDDEQPEPSTSSSSSDSSQNPQHRP